MVTNDIKYREGDKCSRKVWKKLKQINKEHKKNQKILEDNSLDTLSWSIAPTEVHQNIVTDRIGSYKAKSRETLTASHILQCRNQENDLLKYRAVVQNGFILAVIHCDPFYWEPDDEEFTRRKLEDHRGRSVIEIWENHDGRITPTLQKEEIPLVKLLDGKYTM